MITRVHQKAQKRRRNFYGHGKQKVQLVLKKKVKCVREQRKCEGRK